VRRSNPSCQKRSARSRKFPSGFLDKADPARLYRAPLQSILSEAVGEIEKTVNGCLGRLWRLAAVEETDPVSLLHCFSADFPDDPPRPSSESSISDAFRHLLHKAAGLQPDHERIDFEHRCALKTRWREILDSLAERALRMLDDEVRNLRLELERMCEDLGSFNGTRPAIDSQIEARIAIAEHLKNLGAKELHI
jgi:hypothetical protein